jgi:hypothetical protein
MFRSKDFSPDINELLQSADLISDFQMRQLAQQLQKDPFDPAQYLCPAHKELAADLGLANLLGQMAEKDEIILASCSAALYAPLQSKEEIIFRQNNLCDALHNRDTIRQLYQITIDTEKQRAGSMYWLGSSYIESTYSSGINLLKLYTEMLMKLRHIADDAGDHFSSEGFQSLFSQLKNELTDAYFDQVKSVLQSLTDQNGTMISASFGSYLQGVNYVLRKKEDRHFWRHWQFSPSFTIADRDDEAAKDLGHRKGRAVNSAANAMAQAAENLQSFFSKLRLELSFYTGCINLADRLDQIHSPFCIPDLYSESSEKRSCRSLYDISLALQQESAVIGNDLAADHKSLFLITGANQGGKSTFLRSIGQAQLMAQCGMPVAAEQFACPIRKEIFTHFKREEDKAMKSGKLDEELARMDDIADHLVPGSMILFNESFAATNEREGSEICRQITQALIDHHVDVFFVTHLYAYAHAFAELPCTLSLRAERLTDGKRTFHIIPGLPTQTAYGEDLYHKIFKK